MAALRRCGAKAPKRDREGGPTLPFLVGPLIGITALFLVAQAALAREPSVTVGVMPQRSALVLALTWTPILHEIGRETHCHLRFETAPSIPIFQRRLARGLYDIAYLNPAQYVVAHRERGYVAFAADGGKRRPVIVVRKGSDIRSLAGLARKTLVFPTPEAVGASMVPQAALKNRGIAIRAVYVTSYRSVYRAVAAGLYVAGGGLMTTFHKFPVAVRSRLRILWIGPPVPAYPLAALPSIPSGLVARLRAAFVALSRTSKGRAQLAQIGLSRFVATTDAQYNQLSDLRIDSLFAHP